jgi:hypothetical protein
VLTATTATLLALGAMAVLGARLTTGGSHGAPLHVRPWMQTYNLVLAACHGIVLVGFTIGAHLASRDDAVARGLRRATLLCFAAALAGTVLTLLFPFVFGGGPWPRSSTAVMVLHALVFAPALIRALAICLLVLSLSAARSIARDGRVAFVVGAGLAEFAFGLYSAVRAQAAVLVLIHPAPLSIGSGLLWFSALLVLCWLLLEPLVPSPR